MVTAVRRARRQWPLQWWGDPGARWWSWSHWSHWSGVTRLQRRQMSRSHHSQAGGQWLQPRAGGICIFCHCLNCELVIYPQPLTTSQRACPHPLPGPWSGQRGRCVPSGAPWTPSTRRELRRVGWVSSDNCIILPFLLFEKKWYQYLICSVMWVTAVRAKQFKVHNNWPHVITISIDFERVS